MKTRYVVKLKLVVQSLTPYSLVPFVSQPLFVSADMKYIPRNVLRQNQNFVDIREAGGAELTNDIYVRDPSNEIFWFSGKVARVSDISLEDCIARQYALIEQHAANLRPIELYAKRGVLEVWTAPGDSELEVAYNKPELVMQKMERQVEGAAKVNKNFVGFQGEMYDQGDDGFRTWRTNDGKAAKPEVNPGQNPGQDQEMATQADMDQLLKAMDGMDINELYKSQEAKEGREVEE